MGEQANYALFLWTSPHGKSWSLAPLSPHMRSEGALMHVQGGSRFMKIVALAFWLLVKTVNVTQTTCNMDGMSQPIHLTTTVEETALSKLVWQKNCKTYANWTPHNSICFTQHMEIWQLCKMCDSFVSILHYRWWRWLCVWLKCQHVMHWASMSNVCVQVMCGWALRDEEFSMQVTINSRRTDLTIFCVYDRWVLILVFQLLIAVTCIQLSIWSAECLQACLWVLVPSL